MFLTAMIILSSAQPTNGQNGLVNGDHCHKAASEGELMDKKARRKLLIASILCLLFMIGEIVGEYTYPKHIAHAPLQTLVTCTNIRGP